MAGSLIEGTTVVTPGDAPAAARPRLTFEDIQRRSQALRQGGAEAAALNTSVLSSENPDTVARARADARAVGVDPALGEAAPDEVRRAAQQRRAAQILGENPSTAAWLANPSNAAVAHDSVDQLSSIERLGRAFQLGRAQNEAGRAGEQAFLNPLSEAAQARLAEADQRVKALGDDAGLFTAQGWLNTAATAAGQIVDTLTSQRATAGLAVGAAAGAAVVITAPVTVPAAATLAAATGLAATGYAAGQVVDTVGVAIGTSYADLREAGVRDDYARGLAVVAGTTIGAIEAVADRVGFSLAARSIGSVRAKVLEEAVGFLSKRGLVESAKSAGRLYVQNVAIQAGTEFVQELVQVSAEEVGKVLTDPNLRNASPEEIAERVGTAAVKGFQAAVVLGAPGAVSGYRADRADRQSAERNHEALTNVNKELNASPLAQRDREAAIDHASSILPEVGIPADRFIEVVQQKQLTTLVDELGVADQIEKALETGSDIRLSPEQHARLQLSEAGRDMLDHIRIDPNGLTLAESKENADTGLSEEVAAVQELQGEPLTKTQRADLIKMGYSEADLEGVTSAQYPSLAEDGKLTPSQKAFLRSLGFTPEQTNEMTRGEFRRVQQSAPAGTMTDPNNPSLADAEALMGFQAMLRDAKNLGMPAREYVSYLQAIAEAKQEAANRLDRIRLREEQKELSTEFQNLRDLERATATAEVDSRPVFALLTSISPTEVINRESLLDTYRAELNQIERIALSSKESIDAFFNSLAKAPNKAPVFTTKPDVGGGLPAQYVADKYGFASVKEMVSALRQSPNRDMEIQTRTDQLMEQNHPDIVKRMSELDRAIEATHNNKAGAVILQEVNALRREQGRGALRYSALKQTARQRFAQFRAGEVSPNRFVNAERRKAGEQGRAQRKGDRRLAATRAFERLLNFEWAREAYRWQQERASEEKFARKVFSADRSRSKGNLSEAADYFDAAKFLLAKNGIVDGVEASDFEAHADLVREDLRAERSPATMTVGEFREVMLEARRLVKAGQDASKVAVEGAQQDLETAVNTLYETASPLPPATGQSAKDLAKGANLSRPLRLAKYLAALGDGFAAQIEFHLEYLDGGAVWGPWKRTILGGLIRAFDRQDKMRQQILPLWQELAALGAKHERKAFSVSGGLTVNGEPRVMSMRERAILAANMGNASNLDKTMRGYGATEAQLQAEIAVLPEDMRQWVQKLWDTFEKFRPEVEAVYRARMGKSPTTIAAQPLVFADGKTTLRGGYFPMIYDRDAVSNLHPDLQDNKPSASGTNKGDFATDVVFSGMTEERSQSFTAEVALDVGRAALALDSVVHYVTHFEAVNDVKRVLRQDPIKSIIREKLGDRRYEQMRDWIADVATDGDHQKIAARHEDLRAGAELIRKNLVTSTMAYSLTALLAQPLGVFNSAAALGRNPDGTGSSVVGTARLLRGVARMFGDGIWKSANEVREASSLMRTRIQNAEFAIGEAVREAEARGGKLDRFNLAGLRAVGRTQFYFVDLPTWIAARDRAKAMGMSDADQVSYADSVVRTSLGGGQGEAFLSGAQRDRGPLMRLATVFATYPTLLYNFAAQNVGDIRKNPSPRVIASAAGRVFTVLILASFLDALRQGQEPGEDEDPYYHYLKRIFANMVSSIPVVGDPIASKILGFKNPDSALMNALDAAGTILTALPDLYDVSTGDKEIGDVAPRIVKAIGVVTGIGGSAQASRSLDALLSDRTENPYDFLVGPPKK